MKTAREWSKEYWGAAWLSGDERAITARDAEHRAELLKLQDDLLQAANREVAMEATIERLGKDAAAMATENERLKVDLSIERRAYDETLYRLKAELAECEAALQLGREGIQAYCDSENAMRDELAEAKNIAKECRDMMIMQMKRESGEFHLSAEAFAPMWGAAITAATKFLAAPPPAESRCTASAGSCNSPKSCGKAGSCIDARMREVVAPAESTPVLCQTSGCGHPQSLHDFAEDCTAEDCTCAGFDPGDAPSPFGPCPTCSSPAAPPDYMWERPLTTRERLLNHERRIAALEAKGEPGTHAFECATAARDNDLCEDECRCKHCEVTRGDHTKGAKP